MFIKLTNWKKLSAILVMVGAIFILLVLQTKAATQSDAIAVRVMPNPNHDSIDSWYAKQGYKGSPQSLMVDGYEAIRDGRTVFVNAANLDSVNKKLYTNIYLISYNQESETKTLDILGQLVSHWKFNDNITNSGKCSISNLHCLADTDCPSTYQCANNTANANYGKCILTTDKTCLIDSDCPVNLFCDSLKAMSIRDVKRLGELSQMQAAVDQIKTNQGSYPSLQSGTYILGSSLSVWPSWKETLWPQLGLKDLLVDPINTLGYCNGYDANTCWDNTRQQFVNSNLTLPFGSYAFSYTSTKNGINYNLCSTFETRLLGYDTTDGKINANFCSATTGNGVSLNTAPVIVSSYTDGEAGKEFNGYIKVQDAEGDLISWKLSISSPNAWINSGWQSGANLSPVLQDTGDANQKKLYAPRAGNPGSYNMILTLTDSRGAVSTSTIIINISAANKPKIEAEDANYFIDPINPLKYTFSVEGSNSKPTYTLTPLSSNFSAINLAITKAVATAIQTPIGLNKNKIDFSVLIPTSTPITQDLVVPFSITARADGMSATTNINFNLKIEKPFLDFQCENMARIGQAYQISGTSCLLGKTQSGNHSLKYNILSGPSGLAISSNDYGDTYLMGNSIYVPMPTSTTVRINAVNEYGASTEKSFNLKINSFCGDGVKQKPNTEGRGGLYNDGIEECDGYDGVWTRNDIVSPSSTIQYACTSGLNIKSPYPILDSNSCVFKAADQGGGYCGDGVCQYTIKDAGGQTINMENCSNCSKDCGVCVCTPQCGDKICGNDGCGGSCGDCSSGETCVANSCCSTSADVQICADNAHTTYFNGTQVASGTDWNTIQKFPVSVLSGTNLFAIKADDYSGTAGGNKHGVSATLNLSGCRNKTGVSNALSMNTDSTSDWKCTEDYYSNWNLNSYNDSFWPAAQSLGNKGPISGNTLPYNQIWASNETSLNQDAKTIYCRYVFSTLVDKTCQPSCAGKCGGSNSCGGFCPDNCADPQTCGGGGVQYVCGTTQNFSCQPDCSNKCGGSNGCGDICPNTCDAYQVCLAPSYTNCKQLLVPATQITPGGAYY